VSSVQYLLLVCRVQCTVGRLRAGIGPTTWSYMRSGYVTARLGKQHINGNKQAYARFQRQFMFESLGISVTQPCCMWCPHFCCNGKMSLHSLRQSYSSLPQQKTPCVDWRLYAECTLAQPWHWFRWLLPASACMLPCAWASPWPGTACCSTWRAGKQATKKLIYVT
jgi:hypothetical protein